MVTPDDVRDWYNNNGLAEKGPIEGVKGNQSLTLRSSNHELPENENPSALGGATGAKSGSNGSTSKEAASFRTQDYRARAEAATALAHAIAACEPEDAEFILAGVLAALNVGPPLPPFLEVVDDAAWWASWASVLELRAYAVACFQHMPAKMQRDFADWAARQVHGGAR